MPELSGVECEIFPISLLKKSVSEETEDPSYGTIKYRDSVCNVSSSIQSMRQRSQEAAAEPAQRMEGLLGQEVSGLSPQQPLRF